MLTESWDVTKGKNGSLRAAGRLVNSQGLIDTKQKTPLVWLWSIIPTL